jgi:hypothetical protein
MAVIVCMPCRAEAGTARAQTRPLMSPRPMSSRPINSIMPGNTRSTTDGDGNVIRFRPRGAAPRREWGLGSSDMMDDSPVKDLREYESAPESDDDYRYRMRVNLLAGIVVIILIVAGSWVLDALAKSTRESQTWKQLAAGQVTR